MSPHRQKSYPWQVIHQSGIRNPNVASGVDHNGFAMGLQSNPVNHLAIVLEEKRRPQGIGTYFPRTNTCRGRQSQAKGRSQGQMTGTQLQRQDRSNQLSATPQNSAYIREAAMNFWKLNFQFLVMAKRDHQVHHPCLTFQDGKPRMETMIPGPTMNLKRATH
ncbi:unnamed protein product [Citrullus colocynthis]|uniref:Uncharacterized protein n=1 Tax=Citrullus colocynthis TaxID=252529 RepID=A0ABP0Z438_9ROSI